MTPSLSCRAWLELLYNIHVCQSMAAVSQSPWHVWLVWELSHVLLRRLLRVLIGSKLSDESSSLAVTPSNPVSADNDDAIPLDCNRSAVNTDIHTHRQTVTLDWLRRQETLMLLSILAHLTTLALILLTVSVKWLSQTVLNHNKTTMNVKITHC